MSEFDFENIAQDRQEFWKNIYSSYHENNTSQAIFIKEPLSKIMKKNNITSVLELGCNSGGNLLYIIKHCPNINATGIDINERAVKYGKEVEKNTADLQVGSIYDLTRFADKSFDLVFTIGVLLHIPHPKVEGILTDMIRIAKFHTINIERNANKDSIQSYGNGVPHAFAHNYIEKYKSVGQEAYIKNISKVTNHEPKGGADHFIWTNLNNKSLLF